MRSPIQVFSEVGRLKKVLLHRPGQELENLMPEYLGRQLFEDIPYLVHAREEHDQFAKTLRACGVDVIYTVNPFDFDASVEAFKKAVEYNGPSAVITKAPCISLMKKPAEVYRVNESCIGCLKCIKELGCPAMTPDENGKAVINESLCTACGLCTNVCPVGAIKRGERHA